MNTFRSLFHLVLADFLERVRRYSFLIVLGLTLCAGYFSVPSPDANYVILRLGRYGAGYRGVYNSAWIGTVVAWLTSTFLSLLGFYLVKNAVERDRRTGVGQIIAATPISKLLYILGKWVSNFVLLAAIVGLMVLAASPMQLIRGEDPRIDWWALSSPSLFVALPAMAVVTALAVLFETIPGLRGGFGNVVYFFTWIATLAVRGSDAVPIYDPTGMALVVSSIKMAGKDAISGYDGGISGIVAGVSPDTTQTFRWEGIQWTQEILLGRLMWVGVALGIVLVASLSFRRFDPAHGFFPRYGLLSRWRKRLRPEAAPSVASEANGLLPAPARVHLTPLVAAPMRGRFGQTLLAELRLMLKGQRWWWYVVALGLIVASLLSGPADTTRRMLLSLAWIWPVLIWSAMGTREVRHRTEQLVFSAAHPLRRQLAATWLAGVIVAILAGSGVAVRLILAGDWASMLACTVGALFIPSLALALGCWSGSSRLFEVVYMVMWYLGPIEGVPALDFMGASDVSVATGVPLYYLGLTIILLGLAVIGRRRQLQI